MGQDGYPARVWDKLTGEIHSEVAEQWKKFDVRYVHETNWNTLGPKLTGKLHLYCGDMDNYYLNNAVYRMEEFLEATTRMAITFRDCATTHSICRKFSSGSKSRRPKVPT